MPKSKHENKQTVEHLLSLLARGQHLLEQAHETLRHAERVRTEVSTQLAPPPPPPEPEVLQPAPITFPWPPPPPSDEAGHACRA